MESKFKIFVIVAIAVLAVAIVGSTFFVLRALNQPAQVVVTSDEDTNLKSVSLGDSILTNISSEEGSIQHFAKVQISVGIAGSNEEAFNALNTKLTEQSASVRSELITTIGEQTYSMLSGANGKEKLADEIITRLNTLLDTELIHKVYFEEYFIQ